MDADRIKWDERYGGKDYVFSFAPSGFLAKSLDRIGSLVKGRRALDIACGEGRNGIFLAQHGFEVDAVDISERGLERGRRRAEELGVPVNFVQADLEEYRLQEVYDLILNFNFLLRPLIPHMVECLAPGGVILMETILNTSALQGAHNQAFLLQPGELERLFTRPDGSILLVEEDPSEANPVARIMFQKQIEVKAKIK
jgi:2-polyprenyl-3-methyl-5-hydroxy-6-metoxy-1,4-benzoquinol methylase